MTRSKTIEKKTAYNDVVKEFYAYNGYGGEVIVRYTNKNDIIYTSNEDLLNEYFKIKGLNND